MKIIFIKRRFCAWDKTMQKRLRRATLPGGSMRKMTEVNPNVLTIVAFSGHQVAGWAFADKYPPGLLASTYVNPRFRRMKTGAKLLEQLLRLYKKIVVAGWDRASRNFFKKMQKKFPGQVRLIEYWDYETRIRQWLRARGYKATNK